MPDVTVLEILLHGEPIGILTFLPGEKTLIAFNQSYIDNPARPTLSVSFKDSLGELITDFNPTRVRVPPFFANMLPEGQLREYLAGRAGVSPKREFFLLWALGKDLPGGVTVKPAHGHAWPPGVDPDNDSENGGSFDRAKNALRFSLAGIQLKFSAVKNATGGLTIPAHGTGGSWIVKLPSPVYDRVPENEFSMMSLARIIGMNVPDVQLMDLSAIARLPEGLGFLHGQALAVKRFDRTLAGGSVHTEDFAQVFGVFPEDKYKKASYRNIAQVIAAEGETADIEEFIRRLVFNTLIGNADMHLKNWSLIYPDRRNAALAPAYDFVSTIQYIRDDKAALKYARTKRMGEFSNEELRYLAGKARLPERLVLDIAGETVARFHDAWRSERKNLPLSRQLIVTIEAHVKTVPIARM